MMDAQDVVKPEWYWVEYLLRSQHLNKPRARVLWERGVLLVRASSEGEARTKGECCARSKEHSYEVPGGDTLVWTFDRIERVETVFESEIGDGSQVYSQFFYKQEGSRRHRG